MAEINIVLILISVFLLILYTRNDYMTSGTCSVTPKPCVMTDWSKCSNGVSGRTVKDLPTWGASCPKDCRRKCCTSDPFWGTQTVKSGESITKSCANNTRQIATCKTDGVWDVIGCDARRNYIEYKSTDYPSQGDMSGGISGGTLEQCKTMCDNISTCTGFFKTADRCGPKILDSTAVPAYNTAVDYYHYAGITQPSKLARQYNVFKSTDYPGQGDMSGGISGGTLEQCKIMCDNIPNCTGFFKTVDRCGPKNIGTSAVPTSNDTADYYQFTGAPQPPAKPVRPYKVYNNFNFTGYKDLPGAINGTLDQCKVMCDNTPNCTAFFKSGDKCVPKNVSYNDTATNEIWDYYDDAAKGDFYYTGKDIIY